MTDAKLRDREASPLLYLRDDELREGMELLYFAYRDFTAEADAILAERALGRAHHRALHFVARNPGITVMELLKVLRITKQSLGRVLNDLTAGDLIARTVSADDRRCKMLELTQAGAALEQRLSAVLKRALGSAYRAAGPEAVAGFRRVLEGVLKSSTVDLRAKMTGKRK
jgi:DNA-binding MarR family transcriptional regulator